jgi:hypothetical protein
MVLQKAFSRDIISVLLASSVLESAAMPMPLKDALTHNGSVSKGAASMPLSAWTKYQAARVIKKAKRAAEWNR